MAMITFWFGENLETDPIRIYVDETSYTFTFENEEFSVDNFKSKIHELKYARYKLRYVCSIDDLQNHFYEVDKMRDFKQLKKMALSVGYVNIFIEDKSKKLQPPEETTGTPNSLPVGKNGSFRRKHVTMGPRRRLKNKRPRNSLAEEEEDLPNGDIPEECTNETTKVPPPVRNIVIYIDRIAHRRNIQCTSTSCRIRFWDQPSVDNAMNVDMGTNGSYGVA
ncbi:uncharacterized protein LOC110704084 [Chenopodium quinoa]|uniref:uncharacterized protein LOC110704084 n=1 Tax=Chenopodium quinoa TaxID=63459 RepID=UPI000B78F973|nr:uncharacterized protein LOC110704084 [Chenopodium quinoa]